jgi:hypothetical protein
MLLHWKSSSEKGIVVLLETYDELRLKHRLLDHNFIATEADHGKYSNL